MKLSRWVVTVGLILAVSTAALGISLPAGPIIMKTDDRADGTVYPAGGGAIPGVATLPGEDGWGLLQVMQINAPAGTVWSNPITPPPPGARELFGVYWNIQDIGVAVTPGPPSTIQTTESVGVYFAVWEQDAGTAGTLAATSPGLRGGAYTYPGIGGALGNPVLWLTGRSVPMSLLGTNPLTEYYAVSDVTGIVGGIARTYLEVADLTTWVDPNGDPNTPGPGKGVMNDLLDSNLYAGVGSNAGQTADLFLKMTTYAPGGNGWILGSNDDLAGAAIPEPVTVLAVFLGVSGLGGYIRKRTRA